jgi:hypothetical protein
MKRFMLCTLGLLTSAGIATAQDVCGPSKINNLSVGTGQTTASLSWTNSGDDCNTGTATTYEIRRSGSIITDTNWQGATVAATGTPFGNGTDQCVTIYNLTCNTTYYWAIFLIDEAGNRSPLSNVVQQGTPTCDPLGIEIDC